tara:strand:- start:172 stop:396 length:225 start_codon:yes stop_codon:yes gene_type:complete
LKFSSGNLLVIKSSGSRPFTVIFSFSLPKRKFSRFGLSISGSSSGFSSSHSFSLGRLYKLEITRLTYLFIAFEA